jgi:hypothetical protein
MDQAYPYSRAAKARADGAYGARITDMDVDHPEQDQGWDRDARSETETERLDRNWASLLQELRVAQTGVQLLTGFLLTLPFQQRFELLDDDMRVVYRHDGGHRGGGGGTAGVCVILGGHSAADADRRRTATRALSGADKRGNSYETEFERFHAE